LTVSFTGAASAEVGVADHFVDLLRAHQRPGAVVHRKIRSPRRSRGDSAGHRLLTGLSPAHDLGDLGQGMLPRQPRDRAEVIPAADHDDLLYALRPLKSQQRARDDRNSAEGNPYLGNPGLHPRRIPRRNHDRTAAAADFCHIFTVFPSRIISFKNALNPL
jgi:hypothetical protein